MEDSPSQALRRSMTAILLTAVVASLLVVAGRIYGFLSSGWFPAASGLALALTFVVGHRYLFPFFFRPRAGTKLSR